jgi:glutamine amidotransferase
MKVIAVIDYGMGNLRSVVKALEHATDGRNRVAITSDPETVLAAERVVFPGQGAARDCMRELLGLCMGMQALLDFSEENGGTQCLKILPGRASYFGDALARIDGSRQLKIPHMGWNQVAQTRVHPLWDGIADDSCFYFVHSYYVESEDTGLVAGMTDYGVNFFSAIARDNVFAMQCHPEKSAAAGLKLLANFVHWDGAA